MALFGSGNLTLRQRLLRVLRNSHGSATLSGVKAGVDVQPFVWDWQERRDKYGEWDALYTNSIYNSQANGGLREVLLRDVIGLSSADNVALHGYYNPIAQIVDVFQNVLRGQYDKEIKVAEQVDEKPVNKAIIEPLANIWKWSNFNSAKEIFQHYSANLGTCGLRIEAVGTYGDDRELPPNKKRVRIHPIHPREIVDFDEDAEGNVTDVLLEYCVLEGDLGEDREDVTYRERLTKTESKRWKVDDEENVTTTPNALGVCPFVLNRHRDVGGEWGIPAFWGTDPIIHLVNWLVTRYSISISRAVFAKWLLTGAGQKPETLDLSGEELIYVQTTADDAKPTMQALVEQVDTAGAVKVLEKLVEFIGQRQPELILSNLDALSGQSGETLAKLLLPVQEKVLTARSHYEDALRRAMQISLSWGVVLSMWDLGSGMGTAQAADNAYQDNLEAFEFEERPGLPLTPYDEQTLANVAQAKTNAKLDTAQKAAGMASTSEQLRIAGYNDKQVTQIQHERKTQDVTDNL